MDATDVELEDWYIENLIFLQSALRRYRIRKNYLEMMQSIVVRFFIRHEHDVAMITVRKCTANRTTTKHSTHRQGGTNMIDTVDKSDEVVGVSKVDAYLIVAENVKDIRNK
jgi:soluble cytochrome b562